MVLIKFLSSFLFLLIGIKASSYFSKNNNFTIRKYSFNFLTQLTASKLLCISTCIKRDCSFIIYNKNVSSCELYNNNVFLINSPGLSVFVRNERFICKINNNIKL